MFKKVVVFIVLKFWTCGYNSASFASLWLINKGCSVDILRFRNCWRTCAVAVPSVFSSIYRDWFPRRTLAVVQLLHYIHVDRFIFKSVSGWWIGIVYKISFCVYVCIQGYHTQPTQNWTNLYARKGFWKSIYVFNLLFLQNLRTTKTVLGFHVVPMVGLFNYVFRKAHKP